MNDAIYFFAVRVISSIYWRHASIWLNNLPKDKPAVFIGNHIGPIGPVGIICSFHIRLFPWIIADMVDKRLAAEYLRMDFVEPSLGLKPPFSKLIAKALSFITVPMLRSLGCVPVSRTDYDQAQHALNATISLLKTGKNILIFPEAPDLELNPETNMRPFMKGFTRLGELFFQETGHILLFYPVAVHETKKVMIGEPVPFNPDNSPVVERHRLKEELEYRIQKMYLEMENNKTQ